MASKVLVPAVLLKPPGVRVHLRAQPFYTCVWPLFFSSKTPLETSQHTQVFKSNFYVSLSFCRDVINPFVYIRCCFPGGHSEHGSAWSWHCSLALRGVWLIFSMTVGTVFAAAKEP